MPAILLIITVALPIAWLIADLRGKASTRRLFGVIALLWSFGVATGVGFIQNLNANAYFTFATKRLLQTSVQQLQAGKNEAVVRAWSHANDKMHWTYENRAKYREIVDEAVEGMEAP